MQSDSKSSALKLVEKNYSRIFQVETIILYKVNVHEVRHRLSAIKIK